MRTQALAQSPTTILSTRDIPASCTPLLDLVDYLLRSAASLASASNARRSMPQQDLGALRLRLATAALSKGGSTASSSNEGSGEGVVPSASLAAALFPLLDDGTDD